jgi:hypothetical protein
MAMSDLPRTEPTQPPSEGWLPDRLLAAAELDRGDAALAAMLAVARGPGTTGELAGEPAVLSAYQAAMVPAEPTPAAAAVRTVTVTPTITERVRARGTGVRRLAARSTAAVIAVLATLSLGGVATAAYTGALPAPLQDFAHRYIGAPAVGQGIWAHHTNPNAAPKVPSFAHGHPDGSPGGPAARGKSHFALLASLCQAVDKGYLGPTSPAYRALVEAAGGANKVPGYCATMHRPGTPSQRPTTPAHPHPSARAVGSASSRPQTTPQA